MSIVKIVTAIAITLGIASSLPGAAAAHPTTGPQPLLVFLVEHEHSGCPTDGGSTCPRNTSTQWEQILTRDLNAWFRTETYGSVSWQVRVVKNPEASSNGWWPAPHTSAEYGATGNNNFSTPVSLGRDVGETLVSRALDLGALRIDEVVSARRLLIIDNHPQRSAQTNGRGTVLNYYPAAAAFTFAGRRTPRAMSVTATVAAEDQDDGEALTVIEHELGHQLGEPDLYSSDPDDPSVVCPFREPGVAVTTQTGDASDCVGPWDHMALDFLGRPGFGAYTRVVGGWLDSANPNVVPIRQRNESATMSLAPIEAPIIGHPLALYVPDYPTVTSFQRLGGNRGYFQGFLVECRRRLGNDGTIPSEGVLISYLDTLRRDHAQVVARGSTAAVWDAALHPGDTYTNAATGVTIRFTGDEADGACAIQLNPRRLRAQPAGTDPVTPRVVRAAEPRSRSRIVPAMPSLATLDGQRGAFGTAASRSVFAGSGVTVNGSRRGRAIVGARGQHVTSLRRGRTARIRFSYLNAGTAAGRATAIVRVSDPYVATASCGEPQRATGRIVGRVHLPRLQAGRLGTSSVAFRARSAGPIGVTVSFRQPYGGSTTTEQAAVGFQTHPLGRKTGPARTVASRIIIAAGAACHTPVPFMISPQLLPTGWRVRTTGSLFVPPGQRRTIRISVTAPIGAKGTAVAIPVAVLAPSDIPAQPQRTPRPATYHGNLSAIFAGLDLLVRVPAADGHLPAFELPAPAAQAAGAPVPVPFAPELVASTTPPPTPTAGTRDASKLTIDTCPASVQAGKPIEVGGTLLPPHPGAEVSVVFSHTGLPGIANPAQVNGASGWASSHTPTASGTWTVQAHWAGDVDHLPSDSPICSVDVPSGGKDAKDRVRRAAGLIGPF